MNQLNASGQRHGSWEEYYSNGQLSRNGTFLNSERHGPWEAYYYNGNLQWTATFINGIVFGLITEYDENNLVIETKFFL